MHSSDEHDGKKNGMIASRCPLRSIGIHLLSPSHGQCVSYYDIIFGRLIFDSEMIRIDSCLIRFVSTW